MKLLLPSVASGFNLGRTRAKARGYLLPTLLTLLTLLTLPPTVHALTIAESELITGDLIRGETDSAVYYYGDDGLRYLFPNDKTFFTWYENFEEVKWISDESLADIQIGGNVTYKPGVKMIKINSDPTVYAVAGASELRAIDSEKIAIELYGSTWNQHIDDVPDEFFEDYVLGSRIDLSSQYNPDAEQADAFSIAADKGLHSYTLMEITSSGFSPSTVTIKDGTAVRFLNTDNENHSATEWDRVWESGTMEPGDHFTHYFNEIGTWHFYSSYGDRNVFEGAVVVE
ncbi:hypothetical protein EPN81_00500 [Patescibacteria group bacterium]|nr:MAG: hypothetical protein EPN81_00500 [Patescibacteria group bacterium]